MIDGDWGVLKSVTPVQVEGKLRLRLDFDGRMPKTREPCAYSAWAVLDPNFHWAITAYEFHNLAGSFKATVEYQPEITEVAFPKQIVHQDVDLAGNVDVTTTYVFSKPEPCPLVERDFMLEAYGLEPPKAARISPNRRTITLSRAGRRPSIQTYNRVTNGPLEFARFGPCHCFLLDLSPRRTRRCYTAEPMIRSSENQAMLPDLSRSPADRPGWRRRARRAADQAQHQEGFESSRAEAGAEHDRPDDAGRGRLAGQGSADVLQGGASARCAARHPACRGGVCLSDAGAKSREGR